MKVMKREFVSDESKYLYKCPKCGATLEHTDSSGDWHRLNLDAINCYYCPACKIVVEYYYSLNCIKCVDEDDGNVSSISFKNYTNTDYVEIDSVEGVWNFPAIKEA